MYLGQNWNLQRMVINVREPRWKKDAIKALRNLNNKPSLAVTILNNWPNDRYKPNPSELGGMFGRLPLIFVKVGMLDNRVLWNLSDEYATE